MEAKQYIVVKRANDSGGWVEFASADSRSAALELARELPDGTYFLMSVLRSFEVRPAIRSYNKIVDLGRTLQPRPRKASKG